MYKLLRNGLLTSEGKVHAKQKRLMAPAFNHSSIECWCFDRLKKESLIMQLFIVFINSKLIVFLAF